MAKVNEYVNIRETPNQDAQKLGMLYKDCGGDIIERNGEWSKIKSGDVTGWVRNKYLYFGEEAEGGKYVVCDNVTWPEEGMKLLKELKLFYFVLVLLVLHSCSLCPFSDMDCNA